MFESLLWARDSHHRSAVWMRLCARPSPLCVRWQACARVCAWVHTFVCVRMSGFVQSNPDYTHLPVSHFRRKAGGGWGRNRGWERETREERCSATTANTLHMNNRVRSVIPPRRLLHWQAGGSSSISVWKQLRVSTQPAGGLHSSSGELAVSSFLTPRPCCLYSVLLSFFKFFFNVYMWFGNQPYMWDPV